MGDFFKDNPDATGAAISTILVILLTNYFKIDSLILITPGFSYVIALLLSRIFIKKEGKETSLAYTNKFEKIKNDKRSNLEKYTKMSNEAKNPEHVEELKNLIKKTASDIEKLEKMEMDELIEIKQEMNKNKTTLSENNNKLSKAIRDGVKN